MTGEMTDVTEPPSVNKHRAAGPDGISAHMLRVCADQLVGDVQVVVPGSRVLSPPLAQQ